MACMRAVIRSRAQFARNLISRSPGQPLRVTVSTPSCSQMFCSQAFVSATQLKKRIDSLTDQFREARELISDARESEGTVYYSDDMQEAEDSVTETLSQFQSLLDELSEDQRTEVQRSIGLKMQELKAQLALIAEG